MVAECVRLYVHSLGLAGACGCMFERVCVWGGGCVFLCIRVFLGVCVSGRVCVSVCVLDVQWLPPP